MAVHPERFGQIGPQRRASCTVGTIGQIFEACLQEVQALLRIASLKEKGAPDAARKGFPVAEIVFFSVFHQHSKQMFGFCKIAPKQSLCAASVAQHRAQRNDMVFRQRLFDRLPAVFVSPVRDIR